MQRGTYSTSFNGGSGVHRADVAISTVDTSKAFAMVDGICSGSNDIVEAFAELDSSVVHLSSKVATEAAVNKSVWLSWQVIEFY